MTSVFFSLPSISSFFLLSCRQLRQLRRWTGQGRESGDEWGRGRGRGSGGGKGKSDDQCSRFLV